MTIENFRKRKTSADQSKVLSKTPLPSSTNEGFSLHSPFSYELLWSTQMNATVNGAQRPITIAKVELTAHLF